MIMFVTRELPTDEDAHKQCAFDAAVGAMRLRQRGSGNDGAWSWPPLHVACTSSYPADDDRSGLAAREWALECESKVGTGDERPRVLTVDARRSVADAEAVVDALRGALRPHIGAIREHNSFACGNWWARA
mmetsp:Transcript_4240/g.15651  ORF Transcript_4240/g.15651 Transcript_4240/m.15651 type:complete len:131 (-) Transcript_4240:83-475(-)